MKHYCVIAEYETLRVVNDPLRMNLLGGLIARAETGKQIADRLGLPASRVHYHLKELEHNGLIEVERTEEKNGIMQKFYRAVAYDYLIDEDLLPIIHSTPTLFQDTVVTQLQMTMARVRQAPPSSFPLLDRREGAVPFVFGTYEFTLGREELSQWIEKFQTLVAELEHMERAAEAAQSEEGGDPMVFFFQPLGFMSPDKYLVADDDDFPADYQWVSRGIVRRRQPDGERP